MPILLKANEFEAEILQAKMPVLVDFFGERCMPCRKLRPILTELSEEYEGQIKFYMFSADQETSESDEDYEEKFRIVTEYEVKNLPTLLLFVDGTVRRTIVGLHTKQELRRVFAKEGLKPVQHTSDKEN